VPDGALVALASGRDLRELRQQPFGLLEIGCVKALGEPGVDPGQNVVFVPPFPLLVPEPTQAHSGVQLERFEGPFFAMTKGQVGALFVGDNPAYLIQGGQP